MKKIISVLTVLTLLVSFAFNYNESYAFSAKHYSGEELFEGIYFGYGEVGKQFPELWEKTEFKNYKLQEKHKQKVVELENLLKKKDSNYFKKFKQSVTSGDRLTIQNEFIKNKNDITKLAKEELSKNNGDKATPTAIKPGFVVALAYAYVGATHIAAVAVLTAVATGNVAVVGNKVKVKGFTADTPKIEEGLNEEQYIDLIAEGLKL